MSELLRLFIAVALPDDVRARLGEAQDRLRAAGADVSWVRTENLHLTLKFLGELEAKRLPRISAALAAVGPPIHAFTLHLAGLGSFGGRVPRVVWGGIAAGAPEITGLADRVDAALGGVGIPKERRPFSAHATLGRVRSPRNAEALLAAIAEEADADFGQAPVQDFLLMRSQLSPKGSTYTVMERWPLSLDSSHVTRNS